MADINPELGINVYDRKQIRKGSVQQGFAESAVVVEGQFTLPQTDHIAMETRATQAKTDADGTVFIRTASQSPLGVKKQVSTVFGLDEGKVVVEVPFVGGGFGGKGSDSVGAAGLYGFPDSGRRGSPNSQLPGKQYGDLSPKIGSGGHHKNRRRQGWHHKRKPCTDLWKPGP